MEGQAASQAHNVLGLDQVPFAPESFLPSLIRDLDLKHPTCKGLFQVSKEQSQKHCMF